MATSCRHNITGPHRRGSVAPMVMICIVVIISFASLAIDSGHMYDRRAEMQRAVDSAALAGATGLPRNDGTGKLRAKEYAGYNRVGNIPVAPSEITTRIGYWDGVTRTFVPQTGSEHTTPNAIEVTGTRLDVPFYFAPVMGIDSTDVVKEATAIHGAGVCIGIWGIDGITADGDLVADSYDSDKGAYGPGNVHANGDICTCKDIVVNGGIDLYGDAMYGHGYGLTTYGSSYNIYGLVNEQTCNLPTFEDEFDEVRVTNDNLTLGLTAKGNDPFNGVPWEFYVTGNDALAMPPGTYYFTSALVDGQARVMVTGPTVIFVDGPATFTGGGIINLTGDPKNLVIHVSSGPVLLSGGANYYGAIVAPNSTVAMTGGMDIYGTILSGFLDIDGNTRVHVDETLVEALFGVKAQAPILVK